MATREGRGAGAAHGWTRSGTAPSGLELDKRDGGDKREPPGPPPPPASSPLTRLVEVRRQEGQVQGRQQGAPRLRGRALRRPLLLLRGAAHGAVTPGLRGETSLRVPRGAPGRPALTQPSRAELRYPSAPRSGRAGGHGASARQRPPTHAAGRAARMRHRRGSPGGARGPMERCDWGGGLEGWRSAHAC